MISRWTKVRIALCGAALLALAGWVLRRAVQLQVSESAPLKDLAEQNYLKDIELAPQRGRVLDRNGAELASSVELDSVFCNPRQLVAFAEARHGGTAAVAKKLGKALGLDARKVGDLLAQRKSFAFAWLRRGASPGQAAALRALALPGVGIRKEPGRVYPNGSLAASVLGHTGVDGRGLEGVELAYDKVLRGTGVQLAGIKDSMGRELLVGGTVDSTAAAGQDLVLSLDKYLTYVAGSALTAAVDRHKAKAGVAIVMDPRTGDILALANVPTYDPNDPGEALARGVRNLAVTDELEPGSTMKTVTFAAVMDAGKLKGHEQFDCQMGRMTVGNHVVKDDHPKGILTAAEVFKHSSNIGTVKIARRITREALHDALARFGFGKRTGVGLPGERAGILRPARRWGEIEFATHAFGQGLTVTPLQLTAAYAAIAAGGLYRPPRLVLRLLHPAGGNHETSRREGQGDGRGDVRGELRVMSEPAARELLRIMQGVTEGGTAKLAAIEGYPVAGKTGTAQKVVAGRYDPDKYISSFVGIVPADNPRLVIAVIVDEPQPIHYGGVVAAPAFKEIAEAALRYLSIVPTTMVATRSRSADPVPRPRTANAVADAKEGLGSDLPVVEEDLLALDDVTSDPEVTAAAGAIDLVAVPDFSGMSMGQAIRTARRVGLELTADGNGVAVAQSLQPVTTAARGSVCRVSFRPGG